MSYVPIWFMEQDNSKPKQPLIPFTPVPVRHRHDGWTVEKQYAFIEAPPKPASSRARVASLRSLRFTGPPHERARVGLRPLGTFVALS